MDPQVSFPEGWTVPPELTGAAPRETERSEEGAGSVLSVTLLVLAAIAMVVLSFIADARQKAKTEVLRREGRETMGRVTGLRHKPGAYTVRYAFNANGVAITGESPAPEDTWNGLRDADPLAIRFLPSNPAINHPAAWEGSGKSYWVMFFIPAMPVAGAILILIQLRGQRRLVAEGVPTAGVVTRCARGSRGGWFVNYQFRTADGSAAKGSANLRMEIGATICILYLPQNPQRNQPYLGSWYRVAR